MPDDFIPFNHKLKATNTDPTPLNDRYQHLKAIDKRSANEQGTPIPGMTLGLFETRLQKIRDGIIRWAASLVENHFVVSMIEKYPESNITSSAEFCEMYKRGPNTKTMRAMASYAIDAMWGSNNQWAINAEVEMCKMLRIRFSGLKSNGTTAKKTHPGKCITKLAVRRKGSLVEKVRNTGKRVWKEGIYSRSESPKMGGTSKTGVPKMLKQIDATIGEHGFNGKLGLCEGHKDLTRQVDTPTRSLAVSTDNNEVEGWLAENKGKYQSLDDFIGALVLAKQNRDDDVNTGQSATVIPPSPKVPTLTDDGGDDEDDADSTSSSPLKKVYCCCLSAFLL